ncbi:unnamed protein product [Peniophora sp. CBMAI 1063]|nr:unnamed protein product [Peniophora sp. CBMAI 1063]
MVSSISTPQLSSLQYSFTTLHATLCTATFIKWDTVLQISSTVDAVGTAPIPPVVPAITHRLLLLLLVLAPVLRLTGKLERQDMRLPALTLMALLALHFRASQRWQRTASVWLKLRYAKNNQFWGQNIQQGRPPHSNGSGSGSGQGSGHASISTFTNTGSGSGSGQHSGPGHHSNSHSQSGSSSPNHGGMFERRRSGKPSASLPNIHESPRGYEYERHGNSR